MLPIAYRSSFSPWANKRITQEVEIVLKLVHPKSYHCKYKMKKQHGRILTCSMLWDGFPWTISLQWTPYRDLFWMKKTGGFFVFFFLTGKTQSNQQRQNRNKVYMQPLTTASLQVGLCLHPWVQLAKWPAEQHNVCSVFAGSSCQLTGQAGCSQRVAAISCSSHPAPSQTASNTQEQEPVMNIKEQNGRGKKMLSVTGSIDAPEQLKALY